MSDSPVGLMVAVSPGAGRWQWALAIVSTLLTLAALEVPTLFGFDYRERLGTPAEYADGLGVMLDPELLFIARPDRHLVGRRRGDIALAWNLRGDDLSDIHYDVVIDRNGFRNAADLTRGDVVLLGDSFIIGGSGTVLSSVLAERLGVPVVNLGQSGYGPQQELIVLRRYAFAYRPRTVVWSVFEGNDLSDARFYEAVRATWPKQLEPGRAFWNRAFLTNAARATSRLLWPPEESPLARTRSAVLRDGRRIWFMQPLPAMTVDDRAGFEILGAALIEALRLCSEHQAEMVVALIPDKFRVYRDLVAFPPDSECLRWPVNNFPDRLRELVAWISPDLRLIDLTPGLEERARAGELLYFPDDTHWNDAGHRAAAEIMAQYLGGDR